METSTKKCSENGVLRNKGVHKTTVKIFER